jgi:hypothetical protein
MPSSIPYDPSLVLGHIVEQKALDTLTQISSLQAPIDQKGKRTERADCPQKEH